MANSNQGLKCSAMPKSSRGEEACIEEPTIYMMDAGCWTNELMCFGAISGNQLIVGMFKFSGIVDCSEEGRKKFADSLKSPTRLNDKLTNFLLDLRCGASNAATIGGPGSFELDVRVEEARSYHEVEACRHGDLVTASDKLVIFIPDTHLGIKDAADDFYHNGKNGWGFHPIFHRYTCANMLVYLLGVAKSHTATIIQTGDFYDIWEAEVSQNIYQYKTQSSPCPQGHGVRRGKDRTKMALEKIVAAWKEELQEIAENIDYYILGNHDTEVKFLENEHPLKSKIHKGHVLVGPNGEQWEAEHLHRFDPLNDTSGTSEVEHVLEKVAGKSITYWVTRSDLDANLTHTYMPIRLLGPSLPVWDPSDPHDELRDYGVLALFASLPGLLELEKYGKRIEALSKTLFGCIDMVGVFIRNEVMRVAKVAMLGAGEGKVKVKGNIDEIAQLPKDFSRSRIAVLRNYNVRPFASGDGNGIHLFSKVIAKTIEGWLNSFYDLNLATMTNNAEGPLNLPELFLNINFAASRLNAMREIARRLQDNNRNYVFWNPVPWRKRQPSENHFSIPFQYRDESEPICPLPKPPIKLPLRVLIHSHTHSPVIIGLHLRHVSAVCGDGEYEIGDLERVNPNPKTLPSGLPLPPIA